MDKALRPIEYELRAIVAMNGRMVRPLYIGQCNGLV